MPLQQALWNLPVWQYGGSTALDSTTLAWLDLDDHVNAHYSDGSTTVSLYIGYYRTIDKVGAAHSPLVCFPGQGWSLSDFAEQTVQTGNEQIHLTRLIASSQERKVLLIYWFQAYDQTASGTFRQKLNTLLAKFLTRREDNAFVRLSIPLDQTPLDQAIMAGKQFIDAMYPAWLSFVKADVG